MTRNELEEYDILKKRLKAEIDPRMWREQILQRRIPIGYCDSNNLDKVVAADLKEHLMSYESKTGGIIICQGKYIIAPAQFIYGIQPFLHVEYQIQCLLLSINTNVSCTVTNITKDRISAEMFDKIHVVIPNSNNETFETGTPINVQIQGLMPSQKGPAALLCKRPGSRNRYENY